MAGTAPIELPELPPPRTVEAGGRIIAWRESGKGAPLVLLHGIGSGSQSWRGQLDGLSRDFRVIAWDAPGYGGSDPLPDEAPPAVRYAEALAGLLDALGLDHIHLVGHSLGAMMAAAFVHRFSDRPITLALGAPAAGYGAANDDIRKERLEARLHLVDVLGPEGMARVRAHTLLSPDASREALEAVRAVMAGIRPDGYRQAARLLCFGDMFGDLPHIAVPTLVLCGSADTVTPEEGCRKVAAAVQGAVYRSLTGLGHACYVEDPAAFNDALTAFLREVA